MAGPCNDNPKLNCGQGIPGLDGTPGTQIAIRSTAEPVGVNCPYGGWKVEVGPDPGNTGSPLTTLHTFYVCDGAPGTSRAIRVTAEAPGAHCPAGGYKVETGDDTNNDGIPDANIVTSYTCNGTNGTPGVSPNLVAGVITALGYGVAPTASVVNLGGGSFRIDLGIPTGAPGAAGGTVTSAVTVDEITPPDCIADQVPDPSELNDWLLAFGNILCGSNLVPNTFKAVKTYNQPQLLPLATTVYRLILHEDDATPGYYDNGNNFSGGIFVTPAGGITKTFVEENLKLKNPAANGWTVASGGDMYIEIVKNVGGAIVGGVVTGGADTVLATSAVIHYNTVDAHGNSILSETGFAVPALTTGIITLAATDKIYARTKYLSGAAPNTESTDVLVGARLSNY